jgi:hypothetical protein
VGEDDKKLHVIGRVGGGDSFESTLLQEYVKRGVANALSLDQKIFVDLDTGSIRASGEPIGVGLVDVKDSRRGPECVIDAYVQWPEIEEIIRETDKNRNATPKNSEDILRSDGSGEINSDNKNKAKRRLSELVYKLEMDKSSTTPVAPVTTPPAAPQAAAVQPPPQQQAPAPQQAAVATPPPPQEAQKPIPKQEDLFKALEKSAEMLKDQRATISALEAKLKEATAAAAAGTQLAPSVKEKTLALINTFRTHANKTYQGREMPAPIKQALAEMEKYPNLPEPEQVKKHSEMEVACACSIESSAFATQLVQMGEEAKRLREENDGMKRKIIDTFEAEVRMVTAAKKELAEHGADVSSKIAEAAAPQAKRQCAEQPPAAAAAPVDPMLQQYSGLLKMFDLTNRPL